MNTLEIRADNAPNLQTVVGSRMASANLLDRVMEYSNVDVVRRYQEKLNISSSEAGTLFEDMKRFLFLCGTVPGLWTPPLAVDSAWHEFLMFTEDYHAFCLTYFGRFIHHRPHRTGVPPTSSGGVGRTKLAIREIFGTDVSENWRTERHQNAACSPSGEQAQLLEAAMCGGEGSCSCGCSPCDSKVTSDLKLSF